MELEGVGRYGGRGEISTFFWFTGLVSLRVCLGTLVPWIFQPAFLSAMEIEPARCTRPQIDAMESTRPQNLERREGGRRVWLSKKDHEDFANIVSGQININIYGLWFIFQCTSRVFPFTDIYIYIHYPLASGFTAHIHYALCSLGGHSKC